MYYVRFLKIPRIVENRGSYSITSVLTITTDLGDDFYPENFQLVAVLLQPRNLQHSSLQDVSIHKQNLDWRQGMRAITLELPIQKSSLRSATRLYVGTAKNSQSGYNVLGPGLAPQGPLPPIIHAWSDHFSLAGSKLEAERVVERRFMLPNSTLLRIWEDTGNSIARHVWDGALGFLASLASDIAGEPLYLPEVRQELAGLSPSDLNVIELGAGCGVAGLGFSCLYPACTMIMTDLPEVTQIIGRNIDALLPSTHSTSSSATSCVRFEVLDWDAALPTELAQITFHVILVIECIYNSDSNAALVSTLLRLARQSPKAIVLMATKIRHSSDRIFFDLMRDAGFEIAEECHIDLPEETYDDITIDVYAFRLSTECVLIHNIVNTDGNSDNTR